MRVNLEQINDINDALRSEKKQEAVSKAELVLTLYIFDVDDVGTTADYADSNIGKELQETINRVRNLCPDECQKSSFEILRFKLGDRVYGFGNDEDPTLFILSPYLGEGNLIIDPLNDHYRTNKSELTLDSSEDEGVWDVLTKDKQQKLIDGYEQCYLAIPKLAMLPRKPIEHASVFELDTPEESSKIIRACKAGLLKTLLDGNTVHFNVDRYLNHKEFIKQAPKKLDKIAKKYTDGFYTSKELRYAKRLSEFYPALVSNLKFYNKGKEVEAPWVIKAKEWENYHPKTKANLTDTFFALSQAPKVSDTIRNTAKNLLNNTTKNESVENSDLKQALTSNNLCFFPQVEMNLPHNRSKIEEGQVFTVL